jgi:ubiquinol-cytochrome c reductase cytochrome b subunit
MVHIHMGRGSYYGSYMSPKELPWCVGVVIFILMMATASTGYVPPWGQTSSWGATATTNPSSVIPVHGPNTVTWPRGASNVGNATSNRSSSSHYLLPFAIAGASSIHSAHTHKDGSNNPSGVNGNIDKIPSYPYFYTKDSYSTVPSTIGSSPSVPFAPNVSNHPDNHIEANPLVTPPHIVPEWYSSPSYAILRSIPHKTGGAIAMGAALLVLLLIPSINTSETRSSRSRPSYKKFFWLFVADRLILGRIGGKPAEYPYIIIGQIATFLHSFSFSVVTPSPGTFEKWLIKLWLGALNESPHFNAPK